MPSLEEDPRPTREKSLCFASVQESPSSHVRTQHLSLTAAHTQARQYKGCTLVSGERRAHVWCTAKVEYKDCTPVTVEC
jgi:hypothetical protein